MDKKKFAVDFSGWVVITAETKDEAEEKALDIIADKLYHCFDDFLVEPEGVEEEK